MQLQYLIKHCKDCLLTGVGKLFEGFSRRMMGYNLGFSDLAAKLTMVNRWTDALVTVVIQLRNQDSQASVFQEEGVKEAELILMLEP